MAAIVRSVTSFRVPAEPAGLSPRSNAALLTDANFFPWFWGNLASNSGNWLFNVTAAVVVFRLTGSALFVGLVSVAQFVPLALLSPWAGALSDRMDRRRLVLLGQILAAVFAAGLAVPVLVLGVDGLPGAWPVLIAALGLGVGHAITGPAARSLVPALVDDVDLEAAVSLTELTFMMGRALGPIGAGVLLVAVGPEIAFAVNAVSFLVLIGAVLCVHERRGATVPASHDGSVRAGFRYVRADRITLLLLCGGAAAGFAADPVITLGPPLADLLDGGDGLVAAMVSGFGIAAASVALLSARLQRLAGSHAIARTGMQLMAVGLLIASVAPAPVLAIIGFAVTGVGFVLAVTSFTTLLQRRVPDGLRGRVMALWGVAFIGNRPLAAVLDGAAADAVGPRLAMSLAVTVALLGAWLAVRARGS